MSANVTWEPTAGWDLHPAFSQRSASLGELVPPRQAANFAPPALSSTQILRPRLLARLDSAPRFRMAFLVASAGSGKSVLVSQWCQRVQAAAQSFTPAAQEPGAESSRPEEPQPTIVWLTLGAADTDPERFLLSLCAALGSVEPEAVASVLTLLQSSSTVSLPSALTLLLKGLETAPQRVTLVLDDYHVIETRAVHDLVALLIEYLPPQLFLILIDRSDPPLPFHTLRRQGQLIEMRDAELRFTREEATRFLNERIGLSLAPEAVTRLAERTGGWIAGLQMVALALQGVADPDRFVHALADTRGYFVDYLFQEVVRRQPAEVQAFLGQTAFLDRLCGPLCEAVTETRGGQAMLEYLEEARLFLAPLDRERRWYRYEPFFANVLRAWSLSTEGKSLAALRERAVVWYEKEAMAGARWHTSPALQPA